MLPSINIFLPVSEQDLQVWADCISLWSIQAEPGQTTVLETEDGWQLPLLSLPCGNRLMPSGVRFCLEHSTSCIFISRDWEEVCRKYLRLCLMWLRLLFLCLPASVKRRNTSLRQDWDFRTSGKNAKKVLQIHLYGSIIKHIKGNSSGQGDCDLHDAESGIPYRRYSPRPAMSG